MSFDISALNTFRNVNLGGDNAIANLNGEGGFRTAVPESPSDGTQDSANIVGLRV